MLGAIKREETYTSNQQQPRQQYSMDNLPSYDARLRREQGTYTTYASSTVVQPSAPRPMNNDISRQDDLWQRLNQNTANTVNTNTNTYAPNQQYREHLAFQDNARTQIPFEPMKLRDTAPAISRTQTNFRRKEKKQLSTQGKVILAVYLAVVLLIATLVIVNSELINKGKADVAPNASVESLYQADANGLAFIEAPYTSTAGTNWFDKVCDKLSN